MKTCKMVMFIAVSLLICLVSDSVQGQESVNEILVKNHPNHAAWRMIPRAGVSLEHYKEFMDDAKRLIPQGSMNRDLTDVVDNSVEPYFRGIYSQVHGSCSQASAIGYIFTYEMDWARQVNADSPETLYPSHFTYNFLNNGQNWASDPFDGWNIVKEFGVPNQGTFGGLAPGGSFTYWMTGYDNYYQAMQNRVFNSSYIETTTAEGLELLKQWFDNHAMGDTTGGLALFGANTIDLVAETVPEGTPEAGKFLIKQWGPPGQFLVDHLMTFVGYDDRICYDYNLDGRYTNDEDTNGDGAVDMTDWEVGALIIANSWGTGWGNDGFIYLPYRLLAMDVADNGIGLYNQVHLIETIPEYSPLLTMKISLTHTCRNKIRITAGVAEGTSASEPEYTFQPPIFSYQGGPNYMQGGTDEDDKRIELGIDVSPLLQYLDTDQPATYFLTVTENDEQGEDDGQIDAFSLMDYTEGTPVEIAGTGLPTSIMNDSVTYASVGATISFESPVITTEMLPGAITDQSYSESLNATGGSGPYTWLVDMGYDELDGTFDFPDVVGDPLNMVPNNDDGIATVNLGFSFPFYMDQFDAVTVTTDGSIIFGDSFVAIRSSGNLRQNQAITPLGSDLEQFPADGDGVFVLVESDQAIIRWISGRYGDPDTHLDFAAILNKSGRIEFCYGTDLDAGFNFTVGISDGVGHHNISILSGATSIPDNHHILWKPMDYIARPANGMSLSLKGIWSGTPTDVEQGWLLPITLTDVYGLRHSRDVTFMTSSGQPFYTLNLLDEFLHTGDDFSLSRVVGNPVTSGVDGTEYIALDVFGDFWFWPSWSVDVDSSSLSLLADSCSIFEVLEFEWPDVEGIVQGLRFWGALIEDGTGDVVDYDMIEWGYGE